MARLLKSSGEILPNVCIDTLKDMQDLVGGYIEFVYTLEDSVLVVNEEGLINQLPLNVGASMLTGHKIVGDVIQVPIDEFNKIK